LEILSMKDPTFNIKTADWLEHSCKSHDGKKWHAIDNCHLHKGFHWMRPLIRALGHNTRGTKACENIAFHNTNLTSINPACHITKHIYFN
jgi:hypothetical protein